MIGNNTSDYVATDLIHQLWCQHDDKYGHLFPDEPHESTRIPCSFRHNTKNKCKSNNYVFKENSYTEARISQYARKHNINHVNEPTYDNLNPKDEPTNHENNYNSRMIRKRLKKILEEIEFEKEKKKSVPPLINDSTTNSDDSDSHEEQAFHQHHTRNKNQQDSAMTSANANVTLSNARK